ncbi:hypothetical protein CHL76_10620 [Marinococcus halophilus]|uniref:Uncharacterized protein n=1 Tax=Marinococcus halophilus TaxID=1371 RepID=A0A510Y5M2_MARHA|nr:hypothetical protein [Marinococcus halophilus]OZT79838.1 hypothetical protein CHL76_10620 [Marinococcus halophilus]GEK58660.1 hypothetical protein MHA01_15650 [Marinococcus halophilus]
MHRDQQIAYFVDQFLYQLDRADEPAELSHLRDRVFTQGARIDTRLPYIEMMGTLWHKHPPIFQEALEEDPVCYGLLVDMFQHISPNQFVYMRWRLREWARLSA